MSLRPFKAGAFVSLHGKGRDWLVKTKEHQFLCIQTRSPIGGGSFLAMQDETGREIVFTWNWDKTWTNEEFDTIDFDKCFRVDGDGTVFFNKFNVPVEVHFNAKGTCFGPKTEGG